MRTLNIIRLSIACSLLAGCSGGEEGVDVPDGVENGNGETGGDSGLGETGGASATGGAGTGTGGGAGTGGTNGMMTGGAPQSGGAGTGGDASDTGGASTGGSELGTGGQPDPGALPSGTFLMDDDGYVMFEMESVAGGTPPGDWVQVDDGARSGGAFYQYQSTTLSGCGNHRNAGQSTASKMTLNFEVKEKGFHRFIWSNMRANASGGCESDKNNDSFVTFPGALNDAAFKTPFKVYGGGVNSFTWSGNYDIGGHDPQRGAVCVELEAGVQMMEISARSNNHAIDRVAIIYGDESGCNGSTNNLDDRDNTGEAP